MLRYTPVNTLLRDLIASGQLGQLINIQHLEPIGSSHFAHSYVRGNWNNEKKATFALMAKSCHDIDILQYWAQAAPASAGEGAQQVASGENRVVSVSSFGGLMHFRPENAPAAAAITAATATADSSSSSRCLSCAAEKSCPYSAQKIYLDPLRDPKGFKGWRPNYLALIDTAVPDIENVSAALASGPYGRCVYTSDNDVVDHQVVNLSFAQGQTASFTMTAFTQKTCERQTRVFGSRGQIECDGDVVTVYDFATRKTRIYEPLKGQGIDFYDKDGQTNNQEKVKPDDIGRLIGHHGADYYLMKSFILAVREANPARISSGAAASLASHKIVFAAEKARKEGTVVHL